MKKKIYGVMLLLSMQPGFLICSDKGSGSQQVQEKEKTTESSETKETKEKKEVTLADVARDWVKEMIYGDMRTLDNNDFLNYLLIEIAMRDMLIARKKLYDNTKFSDEMVQSLDKLIKTIDADYLKLVNLTLEITYKWKHKQVLDQLRKVGQKYNFYLPLRSRQFYVELYAALYSYIPATERKYIVDLFGHKTGNSLPEPDEVMKPLYTLGI